MAAGYHDWTAGETVTAANVEEYLQLQTIMRFADAATRDAALAAVLTEGLLAYLIDTNTLTVYTGSAWSSVGPVHGAWTSWTPAIVQSGAVTCTVERAKYCRIGRTIIADFWLTVTGTGSAANIVTVSLPVTAASGNSDTFLGEGNIYDSSATTRYPGLATIASTTTMRLLDTTVSSGTARWLGVDAFSAALASGDNVAARITYEAAADA
jgi:hypothetical protein